MFEPNEFQLQMTYVQRLLATRKVDRALAMLSETLEVLNLDEEPDAMKKSEILLRRASCYLIKDDTVLTVKDIVSGMMLLIDDKFLQQEAPDQSSVAVQLVKKIFSDIEAINVIMEFTAKKLSTDVLNSSKSLSKPDIEYGVNFFRCMMELKPRVLEPKIKYINCLLLSGNYREALIITENLMERPEHSKNPALLLARGTCNKHLGNKVLLLCINLSSFYNFWLSVLGH